MGQLIGMLFQQFMMQRQKYSKTLVYVSMVAGVAYMASQGINANLVIGG